MDSLDQVSTVEMQPVGQGEAGLFLVLALVMNCRTESDVPEVAQLKPRLGVWCASFQHLCFLPPGLICLYL